MLDKSFIEKIESMAKIEIIPVNGVEYSTKSLYRVDEPECEPIRISSLKSLIALAKAELSGRKAFIIVDTPTEVSCKTGFFGNKQRDTFYKVVADLPRIEFNSFMSIENMIISLKSKFQDTPDREYLISLLGNITDERSVSTTDDGITQQVTARSGIAMLEKQNVKAIVKLKPFRTFTSVEQPESDFLIRLKDGQAALFEADGGAWKAEAKHNIAEYIREAVKDMPGIVVAE